MGPTSDDKCPYKTKAQGDLRLGREGHVERGVERRHLNHSQGCLGPREGHRRRKGSLGASEGTWPVNTVVLDFWPPKQKENTFLLVQATRFVVIVWQPQKLTQGHTHLSLDTV